jgi:hypothetical protein
VLNARSYYAELEVVGAGPVYVTGRLYEYKGGPLVVQTPTMVDTNAKDPWEDEKKQEKVYTEGLCGIFAQNEQGDGEPAGFKCTWDDVSAVSDFPRDPSLVIDDFESYVGNAEIGATWVDNIPGAGFVYTFLDTATVFQGAKALRLECQNQYDPFFTEATRTFDAVQDWTVQGVTGQGQAVEASQLSLNFRGKKDNVEQPLYVRVEDAAGKQATITHPATYAVQSETWRSWDVALADVTKAGVDLKTIKKLTIGVGNGTNSGQAKDDVDAIYVDNIRLTVTSFTPMKATPPGR